jgi:hypothetical protein
VLQIDEQYQADLADMSNISRFNTGFRYILIVIDIFSRYAWAIPVKNKQPSSMVDAFKRILKVRRPDKLQTDMGRERKTDTHH